MGEMLAEEQRVFRVEVVKSFLLGCVALHKMDHLRPLLEKHGHRLISGSHMSQLDPAILRMKLMRLREELGVSSPGKPPPSRPLSVIFDGSTRLEEAIAIIVRYWSASGLSSSE